MMTGDSAMTTHCVTGPDDPSQRPGRRVPRRSLLAGGGLLAVAGALAACTRQSDPFAERAGSGSGSQAASASAGAVVVGSQQYYSNEIIAELYAQAIEHAGLSVTRQLQIGQREIYLPELVAGTIDVMPEYDGNLLQVYDSQATATDAQSLRDALSQVLPAGLQVLETAEATDQDSYTVTRASAQEHSLTTVADLRNLGRTVRVAASSEFATRPYGPEGVKRVYGVDASVTPVEDSGGPLTVKALLDGDVDVADIYTSDPAIADHDLVVLEDPQGLILPQHVVPLVSSALDERAVEAVNAVQARLTTPELQALNKRSTAEQLDSATIAAQWLAAQGIVS